MALGESEVVELLLELKRKREKVKKVSKVIFQAFLCMPVEPEMQENSRENYVFSFQYA